MTNELPQVYSRAELSLGATPRARLEAGMVNPLCPSASPPLHRALPAYCRAAEVPERIGRRSDEAISARSAIVDAFGSGLLRFARNDGVEVRRRSLALPLPLWETVACEAGRVRGEQLHVTPHPSLLRNESGTAGLGRGNAEADIRLVLACSLRFAPIPSPAPCRISPASSRAPGRRGAAAAS